MGQVRMSREETEQQTLTWWWPDELDGTTPVRWLKPNYTCKCGGRLRVRRFTKFALVWAGSQGWLKCDECEMTILIWPDDCSGPEWPMDDFGDPVWPHPDDPEKASY